MSSLILPSRSFLKPERSWDIPGLCRPRSRWWRHLLGSRGGQTRLQPGSCCGCSSETPCNPCAIPNTNLTAEWNFPAFSGAAFVGTGSGPMIYTAGATYPWVMSCVANGTATGCSYTNVPSSVGIAFKCGPAGTFSFSYNTTCTFDQFCGQVTYDFPGTSGGFTLTSYTCSPFSMTWTNASANNETITIHA